MLSLRVRAQPPARGLAAQPENNLQRGALEEVEAVPLPEAQENDEDEEEALPHSEAVDVFQEGLAMVVQDPLLCDLPIQVCAGRVLGWCPAGPCVRALTDPWRC